MQCGAYEMDYLFGEFDRATVEKVQNNAVEDMDREEVNYKEEMQQDVQEAIQPDSPSVDSDEI